MQFAPIVRSEHPESVSWTQSGSAVKQVPSSVLLEGQSHSLSGRELGGQVHVPSTQSPGIDASPQSEALLAG
jgi:hypothetical protein